MKIERCAFDIEYYYKINKDMIHKFSIPDLQYTRIDEVFGGTRTTATALPMLRPGVLVIHLSF